MEVPSAVAVIDPLPGMGRALSSAFGDQGIVAHVDLPIDELADWLRDEDHLLVLTLDEMVGRPLFDKLQRDGLAPAVVGLVEAFDARPAIDALRAGIAAVAQRADDPDRIVQVVLAACEGQAIVPRSFLYSLAARTRSDAEVDLTHSEITWLRQLASGTTTHDLAAALGYSERAMFRVLHDLYSRLGVANRQQALIVAARSGLLENAAGDGGR